jgi:hypothetical protein
LRHWLRDRLVIWFSALLKGARKLYPGPAPGDAVADDGPRGRHEPSRAQTSGENASAASGASPPKKRSKAWLLTGLLFMFFLGVAGTAGLAYWYLESTIAANDRIAAAALKEAKAAEKKIADAQRTIGTLREDLASLKLTRQSDQARINQLSLLLRNRGTSVPTPPVSVGAPAASAAPPGPGAQAQLRAMSAANDGGCTLTGTSAGTQFKECVAAMNAGQR